MLNFITIYVAIYRITMVSINGKVVHDNVHTETIVAINKAWGCVIIYINATGFYNWFRFRIVNTKLSDCERPLVSLFKRKEK